MHNLDLYNTADVQINVLHHPVNVKAKVNELYLLDQWIPKDIIEADSIDITARR